MDFRNGLVDLVLQHASLVGKHDLVSAKIQEVGAPRTRFVFVQRLDQEVRRACFERFVAHPSIVDDRDDHNRNIHAMRERPDLPHELNAVELG